MTEYKNPIDFVELSKKRSYVKDVFSEKKEKVEIVGWVHDIRALGKIKFLVLRDISGIIQVTAVKGYVSDEIFEKISKVSRESVVYIKGKVADSKQAPGGKEIIPEEFLEFAHAEDLPIDVSDFSKTELPKRLDYRFLDLHRRKIQAIFKIQSTLLQAYHEFMTNEGALEAQFPSIIGSSSEGGTELFEAKYFEKKAFLSQSCQLYKQMLACSMEKVFAVFTVWRAEKHNTIRHLNEARQFDYEQAFADEFVVMDVLGRGVQFMVKKVLELNKEDLNLLEVKLEIPKTKYLTFAEVVELCKKHKVHVGKDDLSGESEKMLGELFPETIVFVHDWPLAGKTFYIMPKEGKNGEELSRGFDVIYKGMEISSGGQRIHLPELLIERLKVKGLNPKDFKAYIDSFRFGAPPHSGFGIGLERLTMLILGLNNIREAVLFPRDRDRLTP
ncbi:aspartate--tRNA(Asn) ligase [Candidatus Pacearchaeota archaeon]|nr:aspartate--tRNA(Asn) ligase [Candidatus Pacearchaeota archaeon]